MIKLSDLSNKTIGLVLSGGGVKGVAHVGVIKALLEHGIVPDIVSGASAGGIVGALYANGIEPEDMLHFFKDTPLLKYNLLTINKPGLFDTSKYLVFFENYFPTNTFEALQKKLFIVATNLETGESEFFNQGELINKVLASAALPPVFSPVSINGRLYADGGIMNNFPVDPLIDTTDFIIGSYTTAMKVVGENELKNSFQLSQRANLLMLHSNVRDKLSIPDLLFIPNHLDVIGVLDKKGIEKAYNIGYEYASKLLENVLVS
ncbi:patatin-like phospholipase family protein [Algibacter pectinivorans]|uniref:NTE family protein n=1 Tax=Algibacter pectinivorans TaxID=870482 RepID=A0A1I1S554_9FLAO|nr:patatin-like phospholipase family protein [Algibacter pectinivorans]SFD39698.1 NTE family protein [Algibacter pectinivorans]